MTPNNSDVIIADQARKFAKPDLNWYDMKKMTTGATRYVGKNLLKSLPLDRTNLNLGLVHLLKRSRYMYP